MKKAFLPTLLLCAFFLSSVHVLAQDNIGSTRSGSSAGKPMMKAKAPMISANIVATGNSGKHTLLSNLRDNSVPNRYLRGGTVRKMPVSMQTKSTSQASLFAGGNLTPYQPSEWDNTIVLSIEKGTFTTSPTIYNNQLIYTDCAFANMGASDISETFYIDFLIDGDFYGGYIVDGLPSGYYVSFEDEEFWPLSSGSHTFKVIVDSQENVSETDESDNEYSRSKTISYREPCVNAVFDQRSDWEDMIVISTVYGTFVSDPVINNSQPIYVDWTFVNKGGCDISQNFDVRIFIDDLPADTFIVESLNSHARISAYDREIGPLTAGSHTIKVVLDAGHVLNEIDETDNTFSKTIQVSQVAACINVTPYQPAGWDSKIVLSTTSGTNTSNTAIYDNQDIFLDWAIINNGNCASGKASKIKIYVDGVVKSAPAVPELASGSFNTGIDVEIGKLTAGDHSVKIVADADGELDESNEADNEFTRSFTILPTACANLTPYKPDEWDDLIVLSTLKETSTSSTVFSTNDIIYIDLALINSGTCDIADTFYMALYIDNILKESFYVDGLFSDYYAYITDLDYGKLSAGNHTFKVVSDSEKDVVESNETDNEYTRTITVVPQTNIDGSTGLPNLSVYPNPFNDQLVIEVIKVRGELNFEMFNAAGQKIHSDRFTNRIEVSTSDLKPGFYLIQVSDGNSVYWRKVIKE